MEGIRGSGYLDTGSKDPFLRSIALILNLDFEKAMAVIEATLEGKNITCDCACQMHIALCLMHYFLNGGFGLTSLPKAITAFETVMVKRGISEPTASVAKELQTTLKLMCTDREFQRINIERLQNHCETLDSLERRDKDGKFAFLNLFSSMLNYKTYVVTHKEEYIHRAYHLIVSLEKLIPEKTISTLFPSDVKLSYNLFEFQRLIFSMKDYTQELVVLNQKLPTTLADLPTKFLGQQESVERVTKIMNQKETQVRSQTSPLILWFDGVSGAGKSYLASLIAECIHGVADPKRHGMLHVEPCQNLRTRESLYSIVDPPTGIEGHSKLLQTLEKCPTCVVLLDEFEKADWGIIGDVFLQAFDENGFFTSNKDHRYISTTLATFILTSNIITDQNATKDQVLQKLRGMFSVPFLNRTTTHFFTFGPCSNADRQRAMQLRLTKWAAEQYQLLPMSRTVRWTEDVTREIGKDFSQYHSKPEESCFSALDDAIRRCAGEHFYLLHHDHTGLLTASTFAERAATFKHSCAPGDCWIYEKFQEESGLKANDLVEMVRSILNERECPVNTKSYENTAVSSSKELPLQRSDVSPSPSPSLMQTTRHIERKPEVEIKYLKELRKETMQQHATEESEAHMTVIAESEASHHQAKVDSELNMDSKATQSVNAESAVNVESEATQHQSKVDSELNVGSEAIQHQAKETSLSVDSEATQHQAKETSLSVDSEATQHQAKEASLSVDSEATQHQAKEASLSVDSEATQHQANVESEAAQQQANVEPEARTKPPKLKNNWNSSKSKLRNTWNSSKCKLKSRWNSSKLKLKNIWNSSKSKLKNNWNSSISKLKNLDWKCWVGCMGVIVAVVVAVIPGAWAAVVSVSAWDAVVSVIGFISSHFFVLWIGLLSLVVLQNFGWQGCVAIIKMLWGIACLCLPVVLAIFKIFREYFGSIIAVFLMVSMACWLS